MSRQCTSESKKAQKVRTKNKSGETLTSKVSTTSTPETHYNNREASIDKTDSTPLSVEPPRGGSGKQNNPEKPGGELASKVPNQSLAGSSAAGLSQEQGTWEEPPVSITTPVTPQANNKTGG